MALLEVSGISKKGEDFVLSDINFNQRKLQRIVIAGETGSGKSTLLKLIAGLAQPDAGEIIFDNQKVLGRDEKLVPGHEQIAYLSQHFELQKFLRVEQILSYANTLSADDATALYRVCQIDHLLKRRSDALSGGERQRIGLAKLLIGSPKLLLLDEPYSNLDMVHKNVLKKVIDDVIRKYKTTCILVSHEPADTLSWADKIIVLKDGHLVQQGTPVKIYHQPVNEYVAGLFGKYAKLSPGFLHAFVSKQKARLIKKNILARPEYFHIVTKKESKTIPARVMDVNFYGCYYEVDLQVKDQMLTILTTESKYKPGKKVFISFSDKHLHLLR
jgi:ABC-type sugar transport system ATPase subunit